MRIAVVQHFPAGDYAEYLSALINEEAKSRDYEIKAWSSSVPASQQYIAENAVVYITVDANSRLILKWWHTVILPGILKKIKAGVVFYLDGYALNAVKIPQLPAFSQEIFAARNSRIKTLPAFIAKQIERTIRYAYNAVVYSSEKL